LFDCSSCTESGIVAGFPTDAPTRGGQDCLPRAGTTSGMYPAQHNFYGSRSPAKAGLHNIIINCSRRLQPA